MAKQPSGFQFEDVPLDEARRMSRGPRIDSELDQELRIRIQLRSDQAARLPIGDGVSPTTMKNRILRVACEVNFPVTIRRVSGGLLFWRSTDEDFQRARETASRLQIA